MQGEGLSGETAGVCGGLVLGILGAGSSRRRGRRKLLTSGLFLVRPFGPPRKGKREEDMSRSRC